MNITGHHVLRWVAIGAIAIAIPRLALAFDSVNGLAFKLAMGPTSAAQKSQSLPATSENTVATCTPSEGTCPKPHRRKRAGSTAHSK